MNSVVKVKGMSCQHCVIAVKKTLSSLEGVQDVSVNLEKAEATLTHDGPVDMKEVRERIEKAGYEVG
ncbi:MAG: heavy metal-associated domain-containing protein [Deltaproteobacteria bacterium]|nr:heavy metal-associated domain-containing protein [Deltaproteobacteria bacterium]